MSMNIADAEKKLSQGLRQAGMKKTQQRLLVLRVFLNVKKPVSHYELLSAAKQCDIGISYHTVMRTVAVMVECGLARQVVGENKRHNQAPRFYPVEAACRHTHVVCRECGAVIGREPEGSHPPAAEL